MKCFIKKLQIHQNLGKKNHLYLYKFYLEKTQVNRRGAVASFQYVTVKFSFSQFLCCFVIVIQYIGNFLNKIRNETKAYCFIMIFIGC